MLRLLPFLWLLFRRTCFVALLDPLAYLLLLLCYFNRLKSVGGQKVLAKLATFVTPYFQSRCTPIQIGKRAKLS